MFRNLKPFYRAVILLLLFSSCNAGYRQSQQQDQLVTLSREVAADSTTSIALSSEPFNTEGYGNIVENSFLSAVSNPLSTFSIDVDQAAYTNVRRFINSGNLPPNGAVRLEEMVNYFNYNYASPQNDDPFAIYSELAACPWNKQHKLLHIGLKGKEVSTEKLPAANLVFLVDVSGSMNAPDKLPLVQASMKLLTDQLREKDKVAIVVYAGAAGMVLPATPGNNKARIKEAIDNLEAGGSTAGAAGIELAYKIARENFIKNGNNRVILATDGDFNVGSSSDEELVQLIEKERKSNIYLTVLGFGTGNYQDNKMQQLADKGNGNHAYIDGLEAAKKILVKEFGGTLFTIAKDVKLQLEFNPAKVQSYRLLGYENRMLQKEDFNNDTKDAGELGAGHTVTALYEIIPVGVTDAFSATTDPLKYQPASTAALATETNELLTIKFRYKKPDEDNSALLIKTVIDGDRPAAAASGNFRFSAAVASFGMLLRNSVYKQHTSYEDVIALAKSATGTDADGDRKEFIDLVERAAALSVTKSE